VKGGSSFLTQSKPLVGADSDLQKHTLAGIEELFAKACWSKLAEYKKVVSMSKAEKRLKHIFQTGWIIFDQLLIQAAKLIPHFVARVYSPLTAGEVRRRLQTEYGYSDKELPTERTLRSILNSIGCSLRKVRKCKPLKKIPETDEIFNEVHRINKESDQEDGILHISLDSKATVKIGNYSREGYSRQKQTAYDHDFEGTEVLTPFGILLPQYRESHIGFGNGKVTANFMIDRLNDMIPRWKERFNFHTLTINADNGPECSGRRTQWLKRLVSLSEAHGISIQLAYYPPYHSQYNPVERLWDILEKRWRGEILDTVEKTLGLCRSMTYRGIRPTVQKVIKIYKSGVSVSKKSMSDIEKRLVRKKGLEPWFISIEPVGKTG